MAIRLLKGNKKMYLITVEGLSHLYLTDESVDFTVEFYINGKYNAGQIKILKKDVHWMRDNPEYPNNSFHCLVDTSSLDKGQMVCDITITYPDAHTLDDQSNVIKPLLDIDENVIGVIYYEYDAKGKKTEKSQRFDEGKDHATIEIEKDGEKITKAIKPTVFLIETVTCDATEVTNIYTR